MHRFAKIALLLPSLVNAMPQYPGTVYCDSTMVSEPSYETKGQKDVTEQYGDSGWENYDSQTCTSYQEACQRQEGNEVTKEVSISFGAGPSFDLGKAVSSGLDFGVSVAYSTTKTEATVEPCPASQDDKPCVCGIQYKAFRQEAWGTEHSSNACGQKVSKDFDVTAPIVKGDKQDPWIQWRPCRSSLSECSTIENMPLCADGV
ncbi:hypothetical protein BDR22DRAFT_887539 [Usnea florida]